MLQRNIISSQSQVPRYVQSPFLAAIQVPKCRETSPWGSQRQGLGAWCWFCYSEYFQSWVKTPAKGAGGLPQAVPNLAYQQQRNWSTKLLRVKWSTVAGSRRWSVPVSLRHRVHFCSVLLFFFFTFLLLSLCLWFHLQEELLPFIYCSSLFAAPGQPGPAPTTYQSQQEWFCQIETWQGEVWLLIYTCNKVFCSPWAEPRSSFRTQLHYNWFITTHPTASPLGCQGLMKRQSECAVMGTAELPAQLCWLQILEEERSQWWNQSFSLWGSEQSSEWKNFSALSGFWIRPLFRYLVQEFGRVAWPPLLWMWFSSNSSIKWSSRTSLQSQMTTQIILSQSNAE